MSKLKEALQSVHVKLFIMLSVIILLIILFLILVNNIVFGAFYLYSKTQSLNIVDEVINDYNKSGSKVDIDSELRK